MLNINSKVREVRNITNDEKQRIEDFLQGAVYSWCKNNDTWFALRDLMGGDNFHWQGTPLIALYEKHKAKKNATELAGKDAGWILKKVINNDKRLFDTKKEAMTRKYKWINSTTTVYKTEG